VHGQVLISSFERRLVHGAIYASRELVQKSLFNIFGSFDQFVAITVMQVNYTELMPTVFWR
jgi:hypothetical protein